MKNQKLLLLILCCYSVLCFSQATGVNLKISAGHFKEITGAIYSSNGKYIATSGEDNTIILWDAKSGLAIRSYDLWSAFRFLFEIKPSNGRFVLVNELLFSEDNGHLISISNSYSDKGDVIVHFINIQAGSIQQIKGRYRDWILQGEYLYLKDCGAESGADFGNGCIDRTWSLSKDTFISTTYWDQAFDPPLSDLVSSYNDDTLYFLSSTNMDAPNWSGQSTKNDSKIYLMELWARKKVMMRPGFFKLEEVDYHRELYQSSIKIHSFDVSRDNSRVAIVTDSGKVIFQRLFSDAEPKELSIPELKAEHAQISDDHTKMAVTSYTTGDVVIWDIVEDKELLRFHSGLGTKIINLSPNTKQMIRYKSDTLSVVNTWNADVVCTLQEHTIWPAYYYSFSDHGRIVKTINDNRYYTDKADFMHVMEYYIGAACEYFWTKNKDAAGKYLYPDFEERIKDMTASYQNHEKDSLNVRIWDFTNGIVSTSQNDNLFFADSSVRDIPGYKLETQTLPSYEYSDIRANVDFMKSKAYRSSDLDRCMYILSIKNKNDKTLNDLYDPSSFYNRFPTITNLINLKTKDTLRLYAIDTADWAIVDRKGFFFSSKHGSSALHYIANDRIFSFDQFDMQYNRPDKILKQIGMAEPSVIDVYYRAIRKRWREMNVDTTTFGNNVGSNAPEIKITNEASIISPLENRVCQLKIDVEDKKYELSALQIWINGVPAYGERGIDLSSKHRRKLSDETVNLDLSVGKNIIEIAAVNSRAVSSYKYRMEISYIPDKPYNRSLYVVALGVAQYKDTSLILKRAAKDAHDLDSVLRSISTYSSSPFANVHVYKLLDEKVSTTNLKKIEDSLRLGNVNDCVIFFYSGHGIRYGDDLYLGTVNTRLSDPVHTAMPDSLINGILSRIPQRQKLYLIDACQSGRPDRDIEGPSQAQRNIMAFNAGNSKKGPDPFIPSTKAQKSYEILINNFSILSRGNGSTILTASRGNQSAYEDKVTENGRILNIENGVFTYCLLKILAEPGSLAISQLVDRILVNVRQYAPLHSSQDASVRQQNLINDWRLK